MLDPMDTIQVVTKMDIYPPPPSSMTAFNPMDSYISDGYPVSNANVGEQSIPHCSPETTTTAMHPGIHFAPIIKVINGNDFSSEPSHEPSPNPYSETMPQQNHIPFESSSLLSTPMIDSLSGDHSEKENTKSISTPFDFSTLKIVKKD